jgi:hypothetical protein
MLCFHVILHPIYQFLKDDSNALLLNIPVMDKKDFFIYLSVSQKSTHRRTHKGEYRVLNYTFDHQLLAL